MKEIKKLFMVYRNGVVADTLRRAFMQQAERDGGQMPYHVIFGLNLPQLSEIARSVPKEHRAELAAALWADRKVRESRLLACYLTDPEAMDTDAAMALVQDLQTTEEADILCMRVLNRMPDKTALATALQTSAAPFGPRCLTRLQPNTP